MGQVISPEQFPESEGDAAGHENPCPACRGRGQKFVTLRRLVDEAGAASEDELLKRTGTGCLHCSGSGQAAAA